MSKNHYKALFVSDLHLGSRKAKVGLINKFLKSVTCDELYLVGDIIDIWRLKQGMNMSPEHQNAHVEAVSRILRMSRKGTKVYYIWGNHDEFIERFAGILDIGNIHIGPDESYTDSNGTKHLVIHGHQFDLITKYNHSVKLGKAGDVLYDIMIEINSLFNWVRRKLGMRYWSLSKYAKIKFKKVGVFMDNFERVSVQYAQKLGYDSIITGHIHEPKITDEYKNCGCWTDIDNLNFLYDNGNGVQMGRFKA